MAKLAGCIVMESDLQVKRLQLPRLLVLLLQLLVHFLTQLPRLLVLPLQLPVRALLLQLPVLLPPRLLVLPLRLLVLPLRLRVLPPQLRVLPLRLRVLPPQLLVRELLLLLLLSPLLLALLQRPGSQLSHLFSVQQALLAWRQRLLVHVAEHSVGFRISHRPGLIPWPFPQLAWRPLLAWLAQLVELECWFVLPLLELMR